MHGTVLEEHIIQELKFKILLLYITIHLIIIANSNLRIARLEMCTLVILRITECVKSSFSTLFAMGNCSVVDVFLW